MKTRCSVVVCFLLSAAMLAQSAKQNKDETAIKNLDQQWSEAVQAKDLDKSVSFYGKGASVFPFNAPIASGPENIRQLWQHLFGAPGFHLEFSPTKIEVSKSGDMAYDIGTFELTMNDAQGNPTTTPGKYVVVWRKQNGQWKAVADIFNIDK
ncbi:MAG TPA: DUF4440 domain-containing protein [Terriglobales bacterium]|nr:DUF4440 domain-containing protein [Terriglobales bacterium]